MKKIKIQSEHITLGQFLKFVGLISFGGMAKEFIANHIIFVNQEKENRRGRKLYDNDRVKIDALEFLIVTDENSKS